MHDQTGSMWLHGMQNCPLPFQKGRALNLTYCDGHVSLTRTPGARLGTLGCGWNMLSSKSKLCSCATLGRYSPTGGGINCRKEIVDIGEGAASCAIVRSVAVGIYGCYGCDCKSVSTPDQVFTTVNRNGKRYS
eukprot:scaffold102793_cov50-Prasinocladus_malaysianus.AAC.2